MAETDPQNIPQNSDEAEKSEAPKKNLTTVILWRLIPWLFVLMSFFVLVYLPSWILDHLDSKKQQEKSVLYSDFVYKFPSTKEDKTRWSTFRFPSERESEDRLFKFRLDGLDTQVNFRVVLAYEPGNERLLAELDRRIIQIIDQIESTIASKNYEEINSIEEREFYLKAELINEINSFLREGTIQNIFFTQFFLSRLVER